MEPETLKAGKLTVGQDTAGTGRGQGDPAAALVRRCPKCGRQFPQDYLFCPDDAAELTGNQIGVGAGGTQATEGTQAAGIRRARVGLALGILVCIGIGVALNWPRTHARTGATGAQSSVAAPASQAGSAPAAPWQHYSNGQLGFSMDVPQDWVPPQMKDLGNSNGDGHMVTLDFRPPTSSASSPQSEQQDMDQPHARIAVDLAATGLDAPGNWRDLDARFRKVYGERYRLIGIQDGTVDGRAASTWQYVLQKKGQPVLERLDVGTFFGGRRHAFLFLVPPDQYEAWQPRFRHMIESIRWM